MNWIAWLRPIGCPNASRSRAYFTDSSTQPCASPTDSADIAIRHSSRIDRTCAEPRPRSPTRFSSGTRQSLNDSSRVSEAFQPTFEYRCPTVNPGVPDGTRIDEISLPPSGRLPVTAVTVTSDVSGDPPLVMNAFEPLMTQCPSSSRAVVRVAPASEPPPGSVRPNAPSASPEHSRGSHLRFCSSEPNR